MELVCSIRARGLAVPNVDPDDGGTNARVLFLLETPGPRAVNSNFVSCSNDDPSARNMKAELECAGLSRREVVLWNVVPHCVSTQDKNANATMAQIKESVPDTQEFIARLPALKAIVFCGRRAQRARMFLTIPSDIELFETYHTGAMAYNHAEYRDHIQRTFRGVRNHLS